MFLIFREKENVQEERAHTNKMEINMEKTMLRWKRCMELHFQ